MTRAVLYRRVSSDEQMKGYSLDFQESDLRAYCAEHGYDVVSDFEEGGKSAHDSLDTRPLLQQIRQMMRRREFDVLVVWRYDRLSRDVLDQAVILREARDAKVEVESSTEPVPSGPLGQALRFILSGVSEQEWHDINQRSQAGRRARAESGLLLPGARAPYGYQWADSKKTRLVVDPLTSPTVVRIFEWAASGISPRTIAQRLSAEEIPSPTGKRYWHRGTILHILDNPIYWGVPVAYRWKVVKQRVPDALSGEYKQRRKHVSSSDVVVLPEGVAPAIVAASVAMRARQYREANRVAPIDRERADIAHFTLRGGIAVCGVCSHSMVLSTRKTEEHAKPIYYCRYGKEPTNKHGNSIVADALEEFVWQQFSESVRDDSVIEQAIHELVSRRDDVTLVELTTRRTLLDENLERRANLVDSLSRMKNGPAKEDLEAALNKLKESEEKMRAEIAELEQRDAVLAHAQRVLESFRSLRAVAMPDKRRLYFDFGVRVMVKQAHRHPHLRADQRCDLEIEVLGKMHAAAGTRGSCAGKSHLHRCGPPAALSLVLVYSSGRWHCELRGA